MTVVLDHVLRVQVEDVRAEAVLGTVAIIGVNVLFKHLKHEDHPDREGHKQ